MSEDRTIEKENFVRRITEKIFGGLTMSWSVVFLFALATAVITTAFLVFPVFKDTSFEKMGETMEAWVLVRSYSFDFSGSFYRMVHQ